MESHHIRALTEMLASIVPEDQLSLLPTKFEKIGDIALLAIPETLLPYKFDIALAYKHVLGVTSVMQKNCIKGEYRIPGHTLLSGTRTETIHHENGIRYELDLSKLMFSSGNINERIHMSKVSNIGTVIDMFAGIGYFTLPLAKYTGSKVIALEKNPISFKYLQRNVKRNKVESSVDIQNIDCRDYSGSAKRIVMGYVGTTNIFLSKAFEFADKGCVVHYHQTVPSDTYEQEMASQIMCASDTAERYVCIGQCRLIKKYSPGIVHAVTDFTIYD